jgi:hypothetical protein
MTEYDITVFQVDVAFFILAILYFGAFFVGKSANKRKAYGWCISLLISFFPVSD